MAGLRDIAIIITNYNMPERTDALCQHIREFVKWPYSLFVVDNGSDLVPPSRYSNVLLPENVQTTGGWLAGLDEAKKQGEWLGYWFLITSAEFVEQKDTLTPMVAGLLRRPELVGIHPALTNDSTTAWNHLKCRGIGGVRRTWMIDNIASLWRADWFDANGGFDPDLKYGWGIDFELCWKAREQDRWLWVHEGVKVRKITDIGYTMQRMNMSADDRRRIAGQNMADVLSGRYGANWNHRMLNEYVEEYMR